MHGPCQAAALQERQWNQRRPIRDRGKSTPEALKFRSNGRAIRGQPLQTVQHRPVGPLCRCGRAARRVWGNHGRRPDPRRQRTPAASLPRRAVAARAADRSGDAAVLPLRRQFGRRRLRSWRRPAPPRPRSIRSSARRTAWSKPCWSAKAAPGAPGSSPRSTARGGSPAERLARVGPALKQWFSRADFYGCPFINAVGEGDKADDRLRTLAIAHKKVVLERIAALCAEAGCREPAEVAHTLASSSTAPSSLR